MYIQDKSRPTIQKGYMQQMGYPDSHQRTGVVITWQSNSVLVRLKAFVLNMLCRPFVRFKVDKIYKGVMGSSSG